MKKILLGLILCLFFQSSTFAFWAQAQETNSLSAVPKSSPLLTAVHKARDVMRDQVFRATQMPGYKVRIVKSASLPVEITLALWNPLTDEINYLTIIKKNRTIVPKADSAYKVVLKRENGVNSEFTVTGEPKVQVVAIKHPVFYSIGTARYPKYRMENTVYVPYSDNLATPEIVAAGETYLNKNIAAVYGELRNINAPSRAFPNKKLADVIDPATVKSIIAIEHVSNLKNRQVSDYLKNFYTILATNENESYAYARSKAQAFGLVQFIPSTYRNLVKLRPELLLETDFEKGMSDPYNAIKAQIGLLDYNLTLLPREILKKYYEDDQAIGRYLAAMYNGGSSRVRSAIAYKGEYWAGNTERQQQQVSSDIKRIKADIKVLKLKLADQQLTKTERASLNKQLMVSKNNVTNLNQKLANLKRTVLKPETVQYVVKFDLVYAYLRTEG